MTPFTMIMMAVAGACAVFAIAAVLMPRHSAVGSRLKDLSGEWAIGSEVKTVERFVTVEQRGKLQRQLTTAGWYTVTPARLIAKSAVFAGAALLAGFAFVFLMGFHGMFPLGFVALVTAGAANLPFSQLNGAVKKRKVAIARALPDLLDMLSSTVQAGLAFNAALAYAVPAVIGPLGDELRAVLSEIRVGRSRADALRSMADRVDHEELKTSVRAIIQSERLGSNLSKVLEDLGAESRQRRLMRGEALAAKLPVLMVIPMALFMLPALFTMIFGAVLADYFK